MQFLQISPQIYSSQVFQELKTSYDDRIKQLNASFTLALQRIQQSEILKEMKGEDLLDFRLQHIVEISKQVMMNEQEMHMEKYMRSISELKAQLAIERKKFELAGGRGDQENFGEYRRRNEVEEELGRLKRQLMEKDLAEANPENPYLSEPKIEIKENNRNPMNKTLNKEENRNEMNKVLMEKYEQVLQLEKKKFDQSAKEQKERMEMVIQSLRGENQSLKAVNGKLNEENRGLFERLSEMAKGIISPIPNITPLSLTPLKQSVNRENELRELESQDGLVLEHFVPRIRKEQSYSYLLNLEKSKEKDRLVNRNLEHSPEQGSAKPHEPHTPPPIYRPSSSLTKLRINRDTISFTDHVTDTANKIHAPPPAQPQPPSPRWPTITKFQEIKTSFAKELADLRTKMSDNRQKLHSPLIRRGRPICVRERESAAKSKIQSPPRYYSPNRYGMKTYHHH